MFIDPVIFMSVIEWHGRSMLKRWKTVESWSSFVDSRTCIQPGMVVFVRDWK